MKLWQCNQFSVLQIHWQVDQLAQRDSGDPGPFLRRLGQWDMREEEPCWTVSPLPLKEMIPPEYAADDDLSSVPRFRPPGQPLPVVKLPSMLLDSIVCPRHDRDNMRSPVAADGIRLMFAEVIDFGSYLHLDLRGPLTLGQLLHVLWKFLPSLSPYGTLSRCLNRRIYFQSDGDIHWEDNTGLAHFDDDDALINSLATSFERSGGLKNNPVFFHSVGWGGYDRKGWYPIELRSYPPYHTPVEASDHNDYGEREIMTVCKLEVRTNG